MFTDSHAHILKEYYESIDDVIKRAKENKVNRIIVDADSIKSCYEVLELSSKYDNIYCCLGIHPENIDEDMDELDKIIEENKDNRKFIAIGEIGLDYYWTKETKEKQHKILRHQLSLAEKYNKPVIIHSREATKDTIDILKEFPNVKGDIHCFSGSFETAEIYLKMGYYIGVGGVLTFKNANIKDVIVKLPLDRLLLETDSPFLAPTPKRGETNEPANIPLIADFLANLKGITIDEVSKQTEENVNKLFNIGE
ncbi:MAG: TatD family hydrolase [Bacilli bacterium]|nr:TatD family hydrolase [Bacilli bacterium]